MSLITLKNIGKIYVSENSIAVGIRGVNLSFDKGEFVSITGKSGSGKSTLLNVISGMDSYEEGEMYVEGKPTSHYTQLDWENYRRKYISFVFQEYNIVESFTVLENVELALMDIKDAIARRKRAIELIEKVGLKNFIKQKGSKLSGGQKQRTVIARALAKDSPIILADEPTGNLDSQSAKEITELLHQISQDKLVIVVTHNFEQFESISTRHIRIFDGSVESDQVIIPNTIISDDKEVVDKKVNEIRNGIHLGGIIFKSKPKLSIFVCTLLIIASIAIFFVTAIFNGALDVFKKDTMFNPIDGRVVLVKQNGSVISDAELKSLKTELGFDTYIHYDTLLDKESRWYSEDGTFDLTFNYTYNEKFGNNIIGTYPTKCDEVFLYLPITAKPYFGTETGNIISFNNMYVKIVGMKYFYDTHNNAKILFSEDGFKAMTLIENLSLGDYYSDSYTALTLTIQGNDGTYYEFAPDRIAPTSALSSNQIYANISDLNSLVNNRKQNNSSFAYTLSLNIHSEHKTYNYDKYDYETIYTYDKTLDNSYFYYTDNIGIDSYTLSNNTNTLFMDMDLINTLMDDVLKNTYVQASLLFSSNKEAKKHINYLNEHGYIAVMSNTTYEAEEAVYAMMESITSLIALLIWFGCIVFLAFFANLCTARSIDSFRPDVAIMRSMGINVKTIKIGVYARMLIALIPAYIVVTIVSIVMFTTPQFSKFFTYLYAWEYVIIAVGMLYLVYRITKKQIKKLFDVSVKKSLRGGANND